MHNPEEQLELTKQVRVTDEVHDILKSEKRRLRKAGQSVSIAKIVCNLVLKELNNKK